MQLRAPDEARRGKVDGCTGHGTPFFRVRVRHGRDTVRARKNAGSQEKEDERRKPPGEATWKNRDTRIDRRIHERSWVLSCVLAGAAAWCLRACTAARWARGWRSPLSPKEHAYRCCRSSVSSAHRGNDFKLRQHTAKNLEKSFSCTKTVDGFVCAA